MYTIILDWRKTGVYLCIYLCICIHVYVRRRLCHVLHSKFCPINKCHFCIVCFDFLGWPSSFLLVPTTDMFKWPKNLIWFLTWYEVYFKTIFLTNAHAKTFLLSLSLSISLSLSLNIIPNHTLSFSLVLLLCTNPTEEIIWQHCFIGCSYDVKTGEGAYPHS